MRKPRWWSGLGALALGVLAPNARAEWVRPRIDLVVASAAPSLGFDRTRDGYMRVDLAVELPVYKALTFSARASPIYELFQHAGNDAPGLSFGFDFRVYLFGSQRVGPFLGAGSGPLWTLTSINGNASRLNLLSSGFVGWQSPKGHWHAALVLEHTSNGATAEPNNGINGLGVSLGFDL